MNDSTLLVPDEALPTVPAAPPPWTLSGDGYILLLGGPPTPLHHAPDAEPAGGPGIVMFVDYATSPVGPYRELLYIPGRYRFAGGPPCWSIDRIYVSTWESVVNGRRNWGIPKDRADFSRQRLENGDESLTVTNGDEVIAHLAVGRLGPAFPLPGWLLSERLRTLVQHYAGRVHRLAPRASGKVGLARLRSMTTDPALFADLSERRVSAASHVPLFRMTFPESTSHRLRDPASAAPR